MPHLRKKSPLPRRVLEACLRGVRFAVKSLFVLLMIVIPVPLLPVAPKMGKSDRRNVPGEVKPKE